MTGPDDPSVQTPTSPSPAASNRHGRRNGNPNHLPFPLVNTQHGASVHQRDLGLLQLPASVAPIAAIAPSDQRGGGGGEEGSLSIYRFMRQPDQPSLVGASSTGHVKLFPRCGMDDNTAWMHGAVRHGGRLDQQVVVVVGMALFFARVVMREREGTCTSKSARQSSLRRCILLHQVLPSPSSACLTICKRTQV